MNIDIVLGIECGAAFESCFFFYADLVDEAKDRTIASLKSQQRIVLKCDLLLIKMMSYYIFHIRRVTPPLILPVMEVNMR